MHCRDVKYIESIKKKTLTFHAGLGPKIHFGILTTNKYPYIRIFNQMLHIQLFTPRASTEGGPQAE